MLIMNSNQRIAFNSVVQYVRLVLSAIIALYSVRIVLEALGSNDFGVYNVVAGVVAMLGFINSSLAQTTIRYISVSLGEGDINKTRETFNSCIWLHVIIGVSLFLLLEILGFLFFDYVLKIDSSRVFAAKIVYQAMLMTLLVTITCAPFSAILVAHEKFLFTAIVVLVDSFAKLAIAFFLRSYGGDRLIMYGILMMLVTMFNYGCYIVYCLTHFKQQVHVGRFTSSGLKQLSSFTSWTIIDVLSNVASRHGFAIVLNYFFGTLVNAAYAVARQIESQMFTISSAVIDTMKPQIMKSYGAGETDRMMNLSFKAGKYGFFMEGLVALPLIVMMPDILSLWLVNVPDNTVVFARLLVISCMMEDISRGLSYACQAVGDIKKMSIGVSLCRFIIIPLTFALYWFGCPVALGFFVLVVSGFMCSVSRIFIMKEIIFFDIGSIIKMMLFQIFFPFALSLWLCSHVYGFLDNGIFAVLFMAVLSVVIYCLCVFFIGLSSEEKAVLKSYLNRFVNKIR